VKSEQHRKDVIRYWWSKAEESLASAKRELDAGSFEFAMNRIYYAAFYAVSSILLKQQISFKKHSAVRSAFLREFVKSGLLDIKWVNFMISYSRIDRREII